MTSLNDMVGRLVEARRQAADAKEKVERLEAEIAQTEVGRRLAIAQDVLRFEKGRATDYEAEVRRIGLEEYAKHHRRDLGHGLKIRNRYGYTYDDRAVISWAIANAPIMLKLDVKMFEGAFAETLPELATKTTEPFVTIPGDLEKRWEEGG